ncbi:MAG: orotidine-5'-phosphate decarboxylase [Planctomycetaceae bacterium]|jgi:orotidine-5'-phosphate decarboxylase|nr:orotidine-5'-phosphate decarboxylase [Planctomycetaceae bacterium]
MSYAQLINEAVRQKGNPVLVGLDPRRESLPASFRSGSSVPAAFERFCNEIIDIAAPLVPAVKPQAAFFEQYGGEGMLVLQKIIRYARQKGLIVIFDGKRNDIGSTAEAYAAGILGEHSAWGADALTVSPYLGGDSIEPFVKTAAARNAGIYLLVKTSNPGGKMLQDLMTGGKPVYRHVAEYVEQLAAKTGGSVGAVVGATWAEQLAELRHVMPSAPLLVPGYGTQGGTAQDIAPAFHADGTGAVVNNSRGIIFAYQNEPFRSQFGEARWQDAVEASVKKMIGELKQVHFRQPAANSRSSCCE